MVALVLAALFPLKSFVSNPGSSLFHAKRKAGKHLVPNGEGFGLEPMK